jgi:hypothetical protein
MALKGKIKMKQIIANRMKIESNLYRKRLKTRIPYKTISMKILKAILVHFKPFQIWFTAVWPFKWASDLIADTRRRDDKPHY